jgi:hypothetical protein
MIQEVIDQTTWQTFDKRTISIKDLTDQHLSNIYWFSRIFFNLHVWQPILDEINSRFGSIDKVLEFKPKPIDEEIESLRRAGLIKNTDIIFLGEKIGTISHLNEGI